MSKSYGLIGYPLTHSFSKKYFNDKFEKQNITDSEYNLYPIEDIALLPQLIKNNPSLAGLNVTIPYKETVIPFLNELDPVAKAIGAVNCIKIEAGKLTGYNTDAFGFRQSIKPFLESQHERALILGTGGASKAVNYILKEIGIDCYFVTREKDHKMPNTFSYDELNEYIISSFKLIINTTPVGMHPNMNDAPPLLYGSVGKGHLLYDLVYNPIETEFLKRGKEHGASVVNGLSMLHQQADEAWRIWNK